MKIRTGFHSLALLGALALATTSCQTAPKNVVKQRLRRRQRRRRWRQNRSLTTSRL
jgi:starvation-inducible outer membrane lipoprotein